VATVSRIDKIIGLLCRVLSLLQFSFLSLPLFFLFFFSSLSFPFSFSFLSLPLSLGYLYQASSVCWSVRKSCRNVLGDVLRIWSTHFFVSSHSNTGSTQGSLGLSAICSCLQLCGCSCSAHACKKCALHLFIGACDMFQMSVNAGCTAGSLYTF